MPGTRQYARAVTAEAKLAMDACGAQAGVGGCDIETGKTMVCDNVGSRGWASAGVRCQYKYLKGNTGWSKAETQSARLANCGAGRARGPRISSTPHIFCTMRSRAHHFSSAVALAREVNQAHPPPRCARRSSRHGCHALDDAAHRGWKGT